MRDEIYRKGKSVCLMRTCVDGGVLGRGWSKSQIGLLVFCCLLWNDDRIVRWSLGILKLHQVYIFFFCKGRWMMMMIFTTLNLVMDMIYSFNLPHFLIVSFSFLFTVFVVVVIVVVSIVCFPSTIHKEIRYKVLTKILCGRDVVVVDGSQMT